MKTLDQLYRGVGVFQDPFAIFAMVRGWTFFGFLESASRPLQMHLPMESFLEMLHTGSVLRTNTLRSIFES